MSEEFTPNVFHLAQCIAALRIEVRTGLKHSRGSVLQLVRVAYGIRTRSKVDTLKALEALYFEATGFEFGRRSAVVS